MLFLLILFVENACYVVCSSTGSCFSAGLFCSPSCWESLAILREETRALPERIATVSVQFLPLACCLFSARFSQQAPFSLRYNHRPDILVLQTAPVCSCDASCEKGACVHPRGPAPGEHPGLFWGVAAPGEQTGLCSCGRMRMRSWTRRRTSACCRCGGNGPSVIALWLRLHWKQWEGAGPSMVL